MKISMSPATSVLCRGRTNIKRRWIDDVQIMSMSTERDTKNVSLIRHCHDRVTGRASSSEASVFSIVAWCEIAASYKQCEVSEANKCARNAWLTAIMNFLHLSAYSPLFFFVLLLAPHGSCRTPLVVTVSNLDSSDFLYQNWLRFLSQPPTEESWKKNSECHDTHKCRLLSATQNLRKATGISCRSQHSRQPVWGLLKRWNDMRMRASYFRKFNVVWDDTDMFVYSVSFFVRLAIFIAPSSAVCADGMWCVGASHFGFLSSYNIVCIKYI